MTGLVFNCTSWAIQKFNASGGKKLSLGSGVKPWALLLGVVCATPEELIEDLPGDAGGGITVNTAGGNSPNNPGIPGE